MQKSEWEMKKEIRENMIVECITLHSTFKERMEYINKPIQRVKEKYEEMKEYDNIEQMETYLILHECMLDVKEIILKIHKEELGNETNRSN